MENFIVGFIVAAAFAYVVKGLVKTWKGKGSCNCSGACSGCPGNGGPCDQEKQMIQ